MASSDAGFDFVDVDAHCFIEFSAGFRVGLLGLLIAALVVVLVSEFFLESGISLRRRKVVVCKPGIEAAADLFNGQRPALIGIEFLPQAAAQ